MSISTLIQLFKSIVQAAFVKRNDPKKWEGWIDFEDDSVTPDYSLNGKFTKAEVELKGLRFEMTVNNATVVLEAKPNISNHLDVFIDGVLDPEARVVVKSKATLGHPARAAVDFRPVTFNGEECRFNLRFKG